MSHRFLAAAAALLAAGPALAGGFAAPVVVPAPAVPVIPAPVVVDSSDWSGAYVGGQLGYGRFQLDDNNDLEDSPLEDEFSGALYGLHAGYMFDFGRLVAGAELDFDGSNAALEVDDEGESIELFTVGHVARAKLRLGFDAGRVLPYVTAGLARVKLNSDIPGLDEALDDPFDGRFVGLGASYMVSDRLMVSLEGLRHEFDVEADDPADEDGAIHATTITLRGSIRF